MATKKKKTSGGKLAAALVGVAAAGYYLYGPKGAQNRQKVRAWSLKAKAEVLEKIEKAKVLGEEEYVKHVDTVTAKYAKMKTIGEQEAAKLNKELKGHWRAIRKSIEKDTR